MTNIKYNKLVRDKIPQIIKNSGKSPAVCCLEDSEYWEALKCKLIEESNEVIEDKNVLEELADVLEVIEAMIEYKGASMNDIIKIKLKKKEARGGFKNRVFLKEVL